MWLEGDELRGVPGDLPRIPWRYGAMTALQMECTLQINWLSLVRTKYPHFHFYLSREIRTHTHIQTHTCARTHAHTQTHFLSTAQVALVTPENCLYALILCLLSLDHAQNEMLNRVGIAFVHIFQLIEWRRCIENSSTGIFFFPIYILWTFQRCF